MTADSNERCHGSNTRMDRVPVADTWTDRLSDYLDDELSAGERRQLDRHLQACSDCRATLDALREVVRRAPALGTEHDPARDLWPAIAPRLAARSDPWWRTALVMPPPGRRLAFLAIAAVLVVAAGAALIWTRPTDHRTRPTQAGAREISVADTPRAEANAVDAAYDDTVAGLRRVVSSNLTADPRVIEVLNRNLESLDLAIADYEDAVARRRDDPRLRERLESARRLKLELLRQAAGLATGATN